jgi:hypothetical protein
VPDCKIRHTLDTLACSSPFDAAQTGLALILVHGVISLSRRDPRITDESDANLPGRCVVN